MFTVSLGDVFWFIIKEGKMKKLCTISSYITVTVLLFSLLACVSGQILTTNRANIPQDGSETYTLILYGGQNTNDLELLAVLDREDDSYSMEPFGGELNADIKQGMTLANAYEEAKRFVGQHTAFLTYETRIINGPGDGILGYEVRPIFLATATGNSDPLDSTYLLLPDNIVKVYVNVDRGFKSLLRDDTVY